MHRCELYLVNLNNPDIQGYFTIFHYYSPELLAKVTIFESNWEMIGTVGMYENIVLENGYYYLWVEHIVREGYYKFYYGPEEVTTGDPYYDDVAWGVQTSLPSFLTLLVVNLILFGCFIAYRRRRRRRNPKI
jgi:hypothetical protein